MYIRNIHTYIYKGIDGQGTNHSIFVTDSAFIQNNCTGGGGGILIGYANANLNGIPSLVEVRDCLFDRNIADSSGGALVGQAHNLGSGNYAIFRRCNFTMNIGISEGSALVFGSLFNVQARRRFYASVVDGWYIIIMCLCCVCGCVCSFVYSVYMLWMCVCMCVNLYSVYMLWICVRMCVCMCV